MKHRWSQGGGSHARRLAKTEPELGAQLHALGFPIDAPQRDGLIGLIADYAFTGGLVLAVDDYHLAHAPELDRLIERIAPVIRIPVVLVSDLLWADETDRPTGSFAPNGTLNRPK